MPNYRRAAVSGGTYFFTVVSYNRRPILDTPLARSCLRAAIRETRAIQPFSLDAIVLLPDHLHAVWTLPRGDVDYSNRWRLIKRIFTRSFLAAGGGEQEPSVSRAVQGERGIWQRRFWEHTCRDETDLRRCVDYLHLNPVRHDLVSHVADWPWSSFHRYVRLGHYDQAWGGSPELFGDEWRSFE